MRTFFATTLLLLCVLFVNAQSSPQFPELRIVNAYKKGVGIKKTKQLKSSPKPLIPAIWRNL